MRERYDASLGIIKRERSRRRRLPRRRPQISRRRPDLRLRRPAAARAPSWSTATWATRRRTRTPPPRGLVCGDARGRPSPPSFRGGDAPSMLRRTFVASIERRALDALSWVGASAWTSRRAPRGPERVTFRPSSRALAEESMDSRSGARPCREGGRVLAPQSTPIAIVATTS